jgi:Tfp pilus assembly protein PilE
MANHNFFRGLRFSPCYRRPEARVSFGTQQRSGKYNRNCFQRFVNDQRGFSALEFLIVFLIIAFLTFAAVDYWAIMVKHQQCEHLMHMYLQRMQVEGYLTSADETQLEQDFNDIGCQVISIEGQRESQGDPRVTRNVTTDAYVNLKLTLKPSPTPIFSGALIGGTTGDDAFRIVVGGKMLSERVNP